MTNVLAPRLGVVTRRQRMLIVAGLTVASIVLFAMSSGGGLGLEFGNLELFDLQAKYGLPGWLAWTVASIIKYGGFVGTWALYTALVASGVGTVVAILIALAYGTLKTYGFWKLKSA